MNNKILDRYRQMMGISHGYTYEYFDYLEHTGHGEYIKLPYHPNNRTRLAFKYSAPTITEECILFGSRNRNRTASFYFYQNANSGGGIFSRTGNSPQNFGNSFIYDWYEIVANTTMEWVRKRPGTSTADQTRTWDGTEFTVDYNLYLFAINHNDGVIGTGAHDSKVNNVAGVKMSTIELYEDQTLLMNLRPARRSDGRTGYHDTLNDVFYFSENEYDFNVGNYADEYIYYDYLENTVTTTSTYNGQQYIRTGINGGSNVKIKIKGQLTQTYRFFMFGSRNAVSQKQFLCRLCSSSAAVAGRTTVDYANSATDAYRFGIADMNKVYTIETFPDHWTRTDNEGNIETVSIPQTTFQSNSIITLFALNQNNKYASNLIDYGRIGECQMWVDNILQRNFQPAVRRWDGKVGMFEKVNSILYQSYTNTAFANYGKWS